MVEIVYGSVNSLLKDFPISPDEQLGLCLSFLLDAEENALNTSNQKEAYHLFFVQEFFRVVRSIPNYRDVACIGEGNTFLYPDGSERSLEEIPSNGTVLTYAFMATMVETSSAVLSRYPDFPIHQFKFLMIAP